MNNEYKDNCIYFDDLYNEIDSVEDYTNHLRLIAIDYESHQPAVHIAVVEQCTETGDEHTLDSIEIAAEFIPEVIVSLNQATKLPETITRLPRPHQKSLIQHLEDDMYNIHIGDDYVQISQDSYLDLIAILTNWMDTNIFQDHVL